MLGLSAGGSASDEDLDAFLEATGVTFPILKDEDRTYDEYTSDPALSPYPIDIVVDADGVIVYLSQSYDADALRDAVERVLP